MKKMMIVGAALLAFRLNAPAQESVPPTVSADTNAVTATAETNAATTVAETNAIPADAVDTNAIQAAATEVAPAQPAVTELASKEPKTTDVKKTDKSAVQFNLAGGVSYWDGDVTTTIGGRAEVDGWVYHLDDPLSELKFPLNVAAVDMDASVTIRKALELFGSVRVAASEPDDKMEDSDWDNGVKEVYSESDCDLNAWAGDAGVRWWFNSKPCKKTGMTAGIAPTVGYKKQSLDWDVKNLDQWYPTEPRLGHDRVDGKVGTYDFDLDMLYGGAKAYLKHHRFSLLVSGGVSAYLNMQAEDDHILRSKKNSADYDGNAWFVEGEGRLYITEWLYLLGRVNYFYAKADGTEKQHYYAGANEGWTGKIDGELETEQVTGTLGLGFEF